MKYTLIISAFVLIIGCGGANEDAKLGKMKKERDELISKINDLNKKLEEVDGKINQIEKIEKNTLVTLYTMSPQNFTHTIDLQSSITTDLDVMIYPEYAGAISWRVKEGQRVSKGQTIATVDDGGMSQQLKQTQIQAELAKTAFEKQERLWNQNIGSEMQYLQAKTNYETAQKQISVVQSRLGKTAIRAPFSGTIDQITMQNGQVVAPGIPIAKIINLSNMKVSADVSEKYMENVKVGTPVIVEIPSNNGVINSKISRVSNFINPSNLSFNIEIPISNSDNSLKPNQMAKLKIIDYSKPNTLVVPTELIQENANGEKYVYVATKINENKAEAIKKIVKTGLSNKENTEILSGLVEGDKLVNEGSSQVSEGSKIVF